MQNSQPIQVFLGVQKIWLSPRTIRFYLDTSGTQPNFLGYFMNLKFYLNIVILFYIWQWLAYRFDQSTELNIAKFLEKTASEKILYFHEVSQEIWPSPRSIQIESDISRCLVFFTDTVWIVGPLGQANRKVVQKIFTSSFIFKTIQPFARIQRR